MRTGEHPEQIPDAAAKLEGRMLELENERLRKRLAVLEDACTPFLRAWVQRRYGNGVSAHDWKRLADALKPTP